MNMIEGDGLVLIFLRIFCYLLRLESMPSRDRTMYGTEYLLHAFCFMPPFDIHGDQNESRYQNILYSWWLTCLLHLFTLEWKCTFRTFTQCTPHLHFSTFHILFTCTLGLWWITFVRQASADVRLQCAQRFCYSAALELYPHSLMSCICTVSPIHM